MCPYLSAEMVLRGVIHQSTCRMTKEQTECLGDRAACRKPRSNCERFIEGMCIFVEGHTACHGDKDFCPDASDLVAEYNASMVRQERLGSLCRAAERVGVIHAV
jgi:hypothetical protein